MVILLRGQVSIPLAGFLSVGSCIGDPVWYHHKGKLSEQCPAEVLETYTDRLHFALMDADSDGTLDFFISLDDRGRSIDFISGERRSSDEYVRATPGCFYGESRPHGLGPSPLLEGVYAAVHRQARPTSLERLYARKTGETDRWLLAVELRNGGSLSERIKTVVFQRLVSGSVTMQSAFVLSGYGEQGIALLAKALLETKSNRAARDAAIYLSDAGASAKVALADLVGSLHRDWKNTRHCVLAAILNIAQVAPQAVVPQMSKIEKYATHWDSDVRRKVRLIPR